MMTPRASSPMARHDAKATRALIGEFYNAVCPRNATGSNALDHRHVILVDLDDQEAFVLLDNPPRTGALRCMPWSDRPPPRNVVSAILLLPGHEDEGSATGAATLATPALRRVPASRQFADRSRSSSSIGATKSLPSQPGSSLIASSTAWNLPPCTTASVAGVAAGVPHEVALNVNDFGLATHVDVLPLQHGHQLLSELFLLLPRLPDFADAEVTARPEADVREQPFRRPIAALLEFLADVVVLLRRQAVRGKPNKHCHRRVPPCSDLPTLRQPRRNANDQLQRFIDERLPLEARYRSRLPPRLTSRSASPWSPRQDAAL